MQTTRATETTDVTAEVRGLARFEGEPGDFWRRFVEVTVAWCGASHGLVVVGLGDRVHAAARRPANWGWEGAVGAERVRAWLARAAGEAAVPWREMVAESPDRDWCVAPLRPPDGEGSAVVVVVQVAGVEAIRAIEKLAALLAAPELYEQRKQSEAARREAARVAEALDVVALLNGQTRFMGAAMGLCNELAARFSCDRVSLGWMEANAIFMRAMSHTEKIEPKAEAVQRLAAAMEECVDQEEEIVHPRPDGQSFVTHAHAAYAKADGSAHVASLPIFPSAPEAGERARPVACVTIERSAAPVTIDMLRSWRLILDQAARPLESLHEHDRWFGARWLAAARSGAARILGPEHTWWKVLAVAMAIGLLVLVIGRKTYRVEGAFTLKTDAMAVLAAPFEGHIASAPVRPGDEVRTGDVLVGLDPRELLLQNEAALAEIERHSADALKAESSGDVAGLRMARAREAQARAQREIVEERLARAEVKAPFDGVVVEGDLRERLASPVQKGDGLVKMARIEDLYLVVEVSERDVQEIAEGATGRAAFASLPGRRFNFSVEKVEPVARTKERGAVFAVRCRFHGAPEEWWRPGMSGAARIDAGRRSLLWIVTHRTVDFLRMWWW
ncbi:MAG: efflux RND transporter periplasmic adaptor subunit [Verrucomicrobiales bacterium]